MRSTWMTAVLIGMVGLVFPAAFIEADGPQLPYVTSLSSYNMTPGIPDSVVTLHGVFTDGDEVTADGVVVPTTYESRHELEATLRADQLTGPGTYELRVRNSSGRSASTQLYLTSERYGVLYGGSDVTAPPAAPTTITTGLLDGDLFPDLVYITGGTMPRLWIATANGTGGFNGPVAITLSNAPTALAVGDVDNDDDDDLIAEQGVAGVASILTNDGSGLFTRVADIPTGHSSGPAIATGDFNGDGKLDFVVANASEGTLEVHLANGANTWSNEPPNPTVSNVFSPIVGDVNRDGALDIVAISSQNGALVRHLGTGDGAFGAGSSIPTAAGTNNVLAAGDVNGDGRMDLVGSRLNTTNFSPRLLVLLGQEDGSFVEPPPLVGQPGIPLLIALDVDDVNGDGKSDVLGVDVSGSLYVLRGDGTGSFPFWVSLGTGFAPKSMAAADLNDDGRSDVLIGGLDTSVFPTVPRFTKWQQQDPGPRPRLNLRDITFTENDSASTLVSMPVYFVDENGDPTTNTVPTSITLSFLDGTATLNQDYRPSPAPSFPIPEGVTQGEIEFRIVGGTAPEPTEYFTVQIATTTDGAVIQDGTAIVTIVDQDPLPPMADLSTSVTLPDRVGPGELVIGTVAQFNSGPNSANSAGLSILIGEHTGAKMENRQIVNHSFQVAVVEGPRVNAGSQILPAGQEQSVTFSAIPTADANRPEDMVWIGGDSTDRTKLGYISSLGGAAGRQSRAFVQDGDQRANDLLVYDLETNILSDINNADAPGAQIHNANIGTAFPGYTLAALDVCVLKPGDAPSAITALVRNPGTSDDESIIAAVELKPGNASRPFNPVLPGTGLGVVVDVACRDIDGDGDADLVGVDATGNAVLLRNEIKLFTAVSLAATFDAPSDVAIQDVDANGTKDVVLIESGLGNVFVLLNVGSASPTPVVSAINLRDLFGGEMIANTLDPGTGDSTAIDFNIDGFPDFALACTRCAPGNQPALVPILNVGGGSFGAQAPIPIGDAGVPTQGQVTAAAMNSPNGLSFFVTDGTGSVVQLKNTTPSSSTVATFDVIRSSLCGSGPSALVAFNGFNDVQPDLALLGCRGFVPIDVGAGSATNDPDPSNNAEGEYIVRVAPGAPSQFDFDSDFRTWVPGTIAQLTNLAIVPVVNSLSGARFSLQNQTGNTVEAKVLSASDTQATIVFPPVPPSFTGSPITLIAETAGGIGTSSTAPELPDRGLPIVSIDDVTVGEDEGVARFTLSLSAPSEEAVVVTFTTSDGTAFGTIDYAQDTRPFTFPPGDTSLELEIELNSDLLDEQDETFFVSLSNPVGATIGDGRAMATIIDDDDPPLDTQPPTIATSPNITIAADSLAGATVTYAEPTVSDDIGVASLECTPPPGSMFPIGTTNVTCTVTDTSGNSAQSRFSVTVKEGTPRVSARIIGRGVTAPGSGIQFFDVEVRNAGSGLGRAVQIYNVQARRLGGSGAVSLDAQTSVPIAIGDLRAGEVAVRRIYVDVSQTVSRIALSVQGIVAGLRGSPKRFSAGGAVIISTH